MVYYYGIYDRLLSRGHRLASSLGFEGMSEIKMLHQDMQRSRHDSSSGH